MQTVFVADWRDQAVFSPDGPHPQVLAQTDKLKAIIGSLEAGQVIPPHPEGSRHIQRLWLSITSLKVQAG